MRFTDRNDAGLQLAAKLSGMKNENMTILAIPRGGIVVGDIVTK